MTFQNSYRWKQLFSVLELMDKDAKTTSSTELFSIDSSHAMRVSSSPMMAPFTELLERFHMHHATDRRDKVYALLGLSNDVDHDSTLRADYSKSWGELLHDVVAHFLGTTVSITAWDEEEKAVVTGLGCPLGSLIVRQNGGLTFQSLSFTGIRSSTTRWRLNMPLSGYDDNIQSGDIICIMEGAR